ncbi:hypothetical protein [Actinokineospora iranica]|nr:hypothetical protein [Actinokineospora iranica]
MSEHLVPARRPVAYGVFADDDESEVSGEVAGSLVGAPPPTG